jgi:mRNA-degrading endonuclease HigB of HigAB toxin-antitoxin module
MGENFRLIATVYYPIRRIYVKSLLTRRECGAPRSGH